MQQIANHLCPLEELFTNQLKILVSKKQLVELTVDEGWFSEHEMVSELKWTRPFFCSSITGFTFMKINDVQFERIPLN